MITAGIDMGARTIKVVVLDDGRIKGKSCMLAGPSTRATSEQALQEAFGEAGVKREDVKFIMATGVGRKGAGMADDAITEVSSAATGAYYLRPTSRTVIDVGAEGGRGIRVDSGGKVADFAINEKCAAGAGAFTEAMARALEVPLEELGPLSMKSEKTVPMNAQCAVFAESEVVSLIHAKTSKADIARAVHEAIAGRIISMVRRVGFEKDVLVVGGVARNIGFIESMKRGLEMDVSVPEDPEFVAALGAALDAAGRT